MTEAGTISSRLQRLGSLSALASMLVGVLLLVSSFGEGLVDLSYDSGYWLRGDRPVSEALIVYMDEPSHRRLGQPWMARWDRRWHARLIERLSALGAKAVAFDVLFEEPAEPSADQALVRAAKASGKVATAAVSEPAFISGQAVGSGGIRRAFAELSEVTAVGVVERANDGAGGAGGVIRRHYFDPNQPDTPSLAWQAAVMAGAAPSSAVGERWLNYYGPPGFVPHRSYFELFETNDPTSLIAAVSNRVIFVGAQYSVGFTGGKGTDDFRTPYTFTTGRVSPGVEINATAYLNLARRDWLRRLPPVLEFTIVLAAGLAFGAGLAALRPHVAAIVSLGLACGVAAAAMGSAWAWGFWFPWGVVVGGQLPVALAFSVLGQSRQLAREKRAFEQALALASEGRGTGTPLPQPEAHPSAGPAGLRSSPESLPEFLRDTPGGLRRDDLPKVPDHDLIRCIGRGGYGEVWLARDIFGALHAVKLMRLADFASAKPIQTEFEGLKQFTPISRSHPGLVHILHVGRDEAHACLYCVMELADDEANNRDGRLDPESYVPRTLARELARRGRLPMSEALELGIALAEAAGHLHANNLVHRDIKPANIVYVQGRPKLADAGLVAIASQGRAESQYLGTPGRIAPEGAGAPAADVFSLGKLLYEAGLGMDVDRFPELPASMIQSGADRALFEFNRVVMRACEADVRRRFGSAAELRDALRRLQGTLGDALPGNR